MVLSVNAHLGSSWGFLSSFFFLFVFSLFMFWLEENDVKRGTPTPTTCGRLTVTLVSLTLYIFFCLLVYLKVTFICCNILSLQEIFIIKKQTIVFQLFFLLSWVIFNSMFSYNLQLAILAHIRIDKTKNDFKNTLCNGDG